MLQRSNIFVGKRLHTGRTPENKHENTRKLISEDNKNFLKKVFHKDSELINERQVKNFSWMADC